MAKAAPKTIELKFKPGDILAVQNAIVAYRNAHPKARDLPRLNTILDVFRKCRDGKISASGKDWYGLAEFLEERGKVRASETIKAQIAWLDTAASASEQAEQLRADIAERGEEWLDEPPHRPVVEVEVDPQGKLFV